MFSRDIAIEYNLNDVTAFATYLSNHPAKQKIWWVSVALENGGLNAVIADLINRIEVCAGKLMLNHYRDAEVTEYSLGTGGFMLKMRLDKQARADMWVIHCQFFLVPSILFHGEYKTVESPERTHNIVVDTPFLERIRNS